jgi:hypothetical protein
MIVQATIAPPCASPWVACMPIRDPSGTVNQLTFGALGQQARAARRGEDAGRVPGGGAALSQAG